MFVQNLTKAQHFKFIAIQWRNDHLNHCSEVCSVSLSDLFEMAKAAGAEFTEAEWSEFMSNTAMHFTS